MTTPAMTTWTVTAGGDPRGLLKPVMARHTTRAGPSSDERHTFFDTFDGRLHRAGGTLRGIRSGNRLELRWERAAERHSVAARRRPGLVRELPDSELRDRLLPIVEVRRLLPLVEVQTRQETIEFIDREHKVVARLSVEQPRARMPGSRSWQPLAPRVQLRRVLGYDLVGGDLDRCLAALPELQLSTRPLLEQALGAIGRPLPHDPCKIDIPLAPGVRADIGLRRILCAYLDVMELNEPYVREDLDPEFLHDFRVAGRRTRALLGQIKEVLPETTSSWAGDELRWLGTLTGPLRDADVFLQWLDDEARDVGVDDLLPLNEAIGKERERALARLLAGLASARYRRFAENWRRVLDEQPEDEPSPPAGARRPLREIAGRRASRIYRRLRRATRGMTRETEADALHEIRLDGKKLRYVLDGCRRMHDGEAVGGFLGHLRKVQTALGDVQDCQLQSERLMALAEGRRRLPGPTLLAVGRLVERLAEREVAARRKGRQRLVGFTSKRERRRFAAMLASRPGRSRS